MGAVVADRIPPVARPGSFILELPCNQQVEEQLRTQDTDPLHRDTFYPLRVDAFGAAALLTKDQRPQIHDGGTMLDFASQDGRDEDIILPCEVATILTHEPLEFVEAHRACGLKDRQGVGTAHENLGQDGPGRGGAPRDGTGRRLVMLDDLMRQGLHHVGRKDGDLGGVRPPAEGEGPPHAEGEGPPPAAG
jgi:hypothetical protein